MKLVLSICILLGMIQIMFLGKIKYETAGKKCFCYLFGYFYLLMTIGYSVRFVKFDWLLNMRKISPFEPPPPEFPIQNLQKIWNTVKHENSLSSSKNW